MDRLFLKAHVGHVPTSFQCPSPDAVFPAMGFLLSVRDGGNVALVEPEKLVAPSPARIPRKVGHHPVVVRKNIVWDSKNGSAESGRPWTVNVQEVLAKTIAMIRGSEMYRQYLKRQRRFRPHRWDKYFQQMTYGYKIHR